MKRIKINLIFKILQCSLENFGESLRVGDGEFCPPEIENTFFFFTKAALCSHGAMEWGKHLCEDLVLG